MFQIAMDIAQTKEAADQSTKELVKLPQLRQHQAILFASNKKKLLLLLRDMQPQVVHSRTRVVIILERKDIQLYHKSKLLKTHLQ